MEVTVVGLGRTDTNDLDVGVDRELTTLDTAGNHGATAGDGEDIFDRHQERLVQIVSRGRDVLVDSFMSSLTDSTHFS